jgi:O-antigen/teichoic acid export membrane protein
LTFPDEPVDPVSTLIDARRSALLVLTIRIGGAGLAYASQVLLARLMGKAEYGIFATLWVWIAILGHGATFGFPQAACRFLPEHRARGDHDLARGFLRSVTLWVLGAIGLCSLLGLGFVSWKNQDLPFEAILPFLLMFLAVPLFGFQDYVEGLARSFNWSGLAIAPIYLLRQGLFAAGTALAIVSGAPAIATTAVLAMTGATFVALAVQSIILLRRLKTLLPDVPLRRDRRLWLTTALPIAASNIMLMLLTYIDVLLLSLFAHPEAVAIYFAATRILQFLNFIQYAATAATAQRFSETHARGDRSGLQDLIKRTARWNSLATMLAALALSGAAVFLLQLFGQGFGEAYSILLVLMLGTVLQTFAGPGEDVLTMLGAEKLCAVITFGILILAALLHSLMIPAFGAMGAACVAAFILVSRSLALAFAARLHLNLSVHMV